MHGIFSWCSLVLILDSLNSQLTSVEGMLELARQYLVTPHGTIRWNVDEELINGRIKPASPEPRSILASLKRCRWTVGPPDRLWHRAHVTPIRHPYQEKMNLSAVGPAELVLCMRKREIEEQLWAITRMQTPACRTFHGTTTLDLITQWHEANLSRGWGAVPVKMTGERLNHPI